MPIPKILNNGIYYFNSNKIKTGNNSQKYYVKYQFKRKKTGRLFLICINNITNHAFVDYNTISINKVDSNRIKNKK